MAPEDNPADEISEEDYYRGMVAVDEFDNPSEPDWDAMGDEEEMERLIRPMMPGDKVMVGELSVAKLSDVEWCVRSPVGDCGHVRQVEDGDGTYMGYHGEIEFIKAVLTAEQMYDRGDVSEYSEVQLAAIPF